MNIFFIKFSTQTSDIFPFEETYLQEYGMKDYYSQTHDVEFGTLYFHQHAFAFIYTPTLKAKWQMELWSLNIGFIFFLETSVGRMAQASHSTSWPTRSNIRSSYLLCSCRNGDVLSHFVLFKLFFFQKEKIEAIL